MRVSNLVGILLLVLGLAVTAYAADRWTLAQSCHANDEGSPGVPGGSPPTPAASCESAREWFIFGATGFGLALCGGAVMLLAMHRGARPPRAGRPQG